MSKVTKEKEIRDWAEERGITGKARSDYLAQMKVLSEESLESLEAYYVGTYANFEREMGDIYVSWINACYAAQISPEDAINAAIRKITNRKGEMVNGRFVKR